MGDFWLCFAWVLGGERKNRIDASRFGQVDFERLIALSRNKRFNRDQNRRGKGKRGRDGESDQEELDSSPPISDEVYLGTVYRVPDAWWGFDAVGRNEHPGACTAVQSEAGQAILLKGTDARNVRRTYSHHVIVKPTTSNGLAKPTAFALEPRPFRMHRVALLHRERQLGRLDDADLELLNEKLREAFPAEEEGNRG